MSASVPAVFSLFFIHPKGVPVSHLLLAVSVAGGGYTRAVYQAAERQLALGHVEPGPFLDAFKEKLSTLRGQSAGLNAELRRARRAAKSNVKAAARAELLSGDDHAAANGKVAAPRLPRGVLLCP